MLVMLEITQDNINAHGETFGCASLCPIAMVLKNMLKEDTYIQISYEGILLGIKPYQEFTNIPFTEDIPMCYRNGEKTPLIPFKAVLDIPKKFLKVLTAV